MLGRALLRSQLGSMLDIDPCVPALSTGARGKPHLASPTSRVQFNLSHSGDVVVVAIARSEVGVDIEAIRPIERAERLARRFFSRAETDAVLAATGAARDYAFLRIWTQKEAWLKATGLGVGMPLCEVETQPDPTRPPHLLAVSGDRDAAARWSLSEAEIPDAVCVVAMQEATPALDLHRIITIDDLGA